MQKARYLLFYVTGLLWTSSRLESSDHKASGQFEMQGQEMQGQEKIAQAYVPEFLLEMNIASRNDDHPQREEEVRLPQLNLHIQMALEHLLRPDRGGRAPLAAETGESPL